MEQQTTSGGSKSTDFQPPTGNPQQNVNGNLQPNSANLQPLSTPNGSNVFNQPGVNPQAFPKTDSLQVLNLGPKSANLSQPSKANQTPANGFLAIFLTAVAVVVIVILVIAKMAKPLTHTEDAQEEEIKPVKTQSKSSRPKKTKPKKHKKRARR